ncbi:hypothetical protein F1721_06925 [Saccharopolyspora hirsuta]|uniref:Uncharacterized protein n=1 Tax=Saccharopolyspora hirsuta TaxID=1837 RepID=A0A5M7C0W8_SACHI|nr:hypothetical protein [Saccharopolyspora hirsuta]KAA5836066.1 hypothetical protein F1721_06925 [Saccharopolyspora hirsuta]
MASDDMWHETKKTSLWSGTVIFWCGLKAETRKTLSEYWYLGAASPKCPACQAAKKAAGK